MDSRVRVILWMASPPTFQIFKYKPPLCRDKGKTKRQLNHTVTPSQNWILSQYIFFFSTKHCISVRQTYPYPFSFMAKCPCPRNSTLSCLHQPLPKFLFTAELSDKTMPWCAPQPEDLLRVPSNAATRPAQALLIGAGGTAGLFVVTWVIRSSSRPSYFDGIPKQVPTEIQPSPFYFSPPTKPISETVPAK